MNRPTWCLVLATCALALTSALLVAGCAAGSAKPAASSTTQSPSARDEENGWEKLSKGEKLSVMKQKVAPKLASVFQAYDSKRYAEFGCKTCHGPQFKDPDDYLPHLVMSQGEITAFKEKPELAQFMAEKVVPETASAMGLHPYDPKTHKGFGCAGCHRIDKQ